MTRITRSLVIAACATLATGCYEPRGTQPAPTPDARLTGSWGTAPTPSGSFVEFSMRAASGKITGGGREFRSASFYDSLAITGEYSETSGAFTLSITYSKGPTADYSGVALTGDLLEGAWFDEIGNSATSFHRAFYQRPQAPCADSASLSGIPTYRAPGYIVVFQDSVDSPTEAARLAALYGFTPRHVWQSAPKGFSADILPTTAALLRCEAAVAWIEYDQLAFAN